MELMTVFLIIAVAGLAMLLLKLLGKALSLAFSVMGIVLVVWLAIMGLKYLDANNIRDNLLDSNNLFLLEDDDALITGFATLEEIKEDAVELTEKLNDPDSEIHDKYFRIISVKKSSLPEEISYLIDNTNDENKLIAFRKYVETNILTQDAFERLVEEEKNNNIRVFQETLAFRHGIKEYLHLE